MKPVDVSNVSIASGMAASLEYWPVPQPTTTWTTGNVSLWPSHCQGNVHVWSCEHTKACLCGKATREAATCPRCGA